MGKKVWIEGIVLLTAGLIGVVDGLRLIIYRNPKSIEDLTGPGRYLLAVGVLLVVVAVCFLFEQRRALPVAEPTSTADKESRTTFAYTIAVLTGYIVLIDLVGYLISTSLFFVLILRVFGFKSWIHTVLVGLAMSVIYYVIFMRALEMPFPHGTLFS